ncbi:MAG: hypothetical protein GY935_25390 [Gammaproteobacteria bacterium]|nr:hypothetical protein [Gammaproteobacteria bacterium]
MAVEVKQMIINTTLVSGDSDRDKLENPDLSEIDLELLKEEVMEECRELIEQSLNELQER